MWGKRRDNRAYIRMYIYKTYRKMTRRKIEKNEIKEDNIEIQRKIADYFKMVEKIKEENNWS